MLRQQKLKKLLRVLKQPRKPLKRLPRKQLNNLRRALPAFCYTKYRGSLIAEAIMWKVYLSRWINHRFLNGKPDQMVSSRVYVEHHVFYEAIIDRLFFWHVRHCRRTFLWEMKYEAEKKRRQTTQGETQPTTPDADGLASLSERSV